MSNKQMILIQFDDRNQYDCYVRAKNKWLENDKQWTKRIEKMLSDVGLNPKEIIKAIEHNDGLTYNNSAHQIVL
jgi:hypothetical protein